ncbi:MAG TPA: D-alanyl-lipoteichoic acid biosynthesis protein DltD, partial [Ligilactobacillus aviarius]|nr:D-alanyl-lipoteichoic acid biosynthesis protein DltD [Ligilactobacillus aviarius]
MKLKKKLFEIFGPVVCAAVILIAILVSPFNFRSFNSKTIREAAVSQSTNIFKGTVVKQKALEEGYVP